MIKRIPANIIDVEIVVVAKRLTAIATLVADSSKKAHDSIARIHEILAPLHVDIAIDCVSGEWMSAPLVEEGGASSSVPQSSTNADRAASTLPSSMTNTAAVRATLVITAIKEVGVPVAFIADVLQVRRFEYTQ
jgi:hypothetical protein